MASICRLCATLKNLEAFVCIHEINFDLCNKLEKCCQLIIPKSNDVLPQNVCNECIIKLNNSWKFYEKVHESQDSLSKIFYISDNEDEINDGKFYEKLTCPVRSIQQTKSNLIDINNEEYEQTYENNKQNDVEQDQQINDNYDNIEIEEHLKLQNYNDNDNNHIEIKEDNEIDDINDDETATIHYRLEENCYDNDLNTNSSDNNYQLIDSNDSNNENLILSTKTTDEINELLNDNNFEQSKELQLLETWQDYPWKCVDCNDYIGKNAIELREHVVTLHGSEWSVKYLCVDCLKTFDKYYSFINHIKFRHRQQLNLCCDLCTQIFNNIQLLIDHRQTEHLNLIGLKTNFDNGKRIVSKSKKFNEFQLYFCTICIKAFNSNNALMVHKKGHEPDKYRLQCDICTKKFATKPNLKAHLKIHSGLKEYVCDHCAKGFVQKANLEEHMLIHIKDQPYKCEECNKKFKTPDRLAKHKSIHTNIRPFKCDECGNTFREKDTLRVHMRIHTGSMPYECEHCGKRFRFRSVLTTHRHQHTGERPYSCTDCNHHFTNWPNFNKHMKRRHGIDTSQSHRNGQTNINNIVEQQNQSTK